MKRVTLGDIATILSGGTPARNMPQYWGGRIPWVKTGEIGFCRITNTEESITQEGLENSAARIIPKGTILMAMYGQGKTRGQVAILEIDAAINQACAAILLNDDVNRDFIYQQLAFHYLAIRKLSNSGSQNNLNADLIRSIAFPLPAPPEQKKIAAILGTWDSMIEKLQALVTAKNERLSALQQQLLTGTRRFPEFKDERWTNLKLGNVVTYQPRLTTKPKGVFLAAGIRSHGKGVFLKHDFEPEEIALDELWELRTDDLVVNITFGWEGAVAIVPSEANGALVSHRFPTFVFKPGVSFPGYFRHVIRQQTFIFEMGLASPGGAGRNRVLSKKNFLRIPIKLPPLEEQKRIAAVLNACAQEINLLEAELEALKLQKRGLMQKLLTGDLRVKP